MVQAVLTPNLVELVKRESKDCAEKQEPVLLAVLPGGQWGPFSGAKYRLPAAFQGRSKTWGVLLTAFPWPSEFPRWSLET